MKQLVTNSNCENFYLIIHKVYKNLKDKNKIPDFYYIKDSITEYVEDNNIKYMSFEGMVLESYELIDYYLFCALNKEKIFYKLKGRIFNSMNQVIFHESNILIYPKYL